MLLLSLLSPPAAGRTLQHAPLRAAAVLGGMRGLCSPPTAPKSHPDLPASVPWFPRSEGDLDHLRQRILEGGDQLQADHPGFNDPEYRERRRRIAENALKYTAGSPLPDVEYTPAENQVWKIVYEKLVGMYPSHASKQFLEQLRSIELSADRIPQLSEISPQLEAKTGWKMRPVAGLLSARDFINALAFRVFHSTQYIRHPSVPLYTPEPDLVHEFLGHALMFACPPFAAFSQEIGLASLGASDEDILRLSRCYWFTVEFGLMLEDGKEKAYGAGLLSSFGELEHALSDKPEKRPFTPESAGNQDYPITTYQPIYYVAESFERMATQVRQFAATFNRPFEVEYVASSNTVNVHPKNVK